jgi:DNA-binding NarL/FixJ family response regulator
MVIDMNAIREHAPIRVVVADDHAAVRAGIRRLLAGADDIVVVGEAANGAQALQLVETLEPDVLLLDVEMPVMDGLQVAARLREKGEAVRVLALSAYDDRQYILGMLRGGASGYLTKDEVPSILLTALRSVAAGQADWLSKRLLERLQINPEND